MLRYRRHRIYYGVEDSIITIVRILHEARDARALTD